MYDINVGSFFSLSPKHRRRSARSPSSSSNNSNGGGGSYYYNRSSSPGSDDDVLSFPLPYKARDSRNLIIFSETYSRSSEPGISLSEHVSGGGASNLMDPHARIADIAPSVAGGKMHLLITQWGHHVSGSSTFVCFQISPNTTRADLAQEIAKKYRSHCAALARPGGTYADPSLFRTLRLTSIRLNNQTRQWEADIAMDD